MRVRWLNKIGKLASQNGARIHKSARSTYFSSLFFSWEGLARNVAAANRSWRQQNINGDRQLLSIGWTSNAWKIIRGRKKNKKRKARPCPQSCEGFLFWFFRFFHTLKWITDGFVTVISLLKNGTTVVARIFFQWAITTFLHATSR